MCGEDLFDSLSAPGDDQLVRVNKIITQLCRQQLAHSGFAGPHETGDNDIGSSHNLYSMPCFNNKSRRLFPRLLFLVNDYADQYMFRS